jgi:hypothetical protein
VRHKLSGGIAVGTDVTTVPRPGGVTVHRKLIIAGTLLVLLAFTAGLCSAPASSAASHHKALRYRVIGHMKNYDVVRGHHRTLRVMHHRRYVAIQGAWRYRVVKRHHRFVILRRLTSVSSVAAAGSASLPGVPESVGRRSWASSTAAGYTATAGNDGRTTTRWTAASRSFPQWWVVDLGAPTTLCGVKIDWYGAKRVYRYRIETSLDGQTFTSVADRSANQVRGGTIDTLAVPARYVRVQVLGASPSSAPASAYEITVNAGASPAPAPTPDPSPTPTATPTPTPTVVPTGGTLNLNPPNGYVFNGGGTYTTSGTLHLGNNCTIIGVKFTNSGRQVVIHGDGNTVRDCTFGPNSWTALMIEVGSHNVINANTFKGTPGSGSSIQVTGGGFNQITNNTITGGVTAIAFTWSRDLSGGGPASVIQGNQVTGNVYSGYTEEGISFDCHGNSADDCPAFEYDTIASVSGQAVTLSNLPFPNYVGYDIAFVDGGLRSRTRTITGQSGHVFTVAGSLTGAAPGDHVVICAPFQNNYVAYNTGTDAVSNSDPFSAIILYGLGFGNVIEHNTVVTGKITVDCIDYTAVATGSATGTHGRCAMGYNTVQYNDVQDVHGSIRLIYYALGGSSAPLVSEGNNVVGNTTPTVSADRQYAYISGNSGTESLSSVTKAVAPFVYDNGGL